MIEMATGKPPWPDYSNNLAALFHVATSKDPPPTPETLSSDGADFLSKCLVIEAKDRATCKELLALPFFASEREKADKEKVAKKALKAAASATTAAAMGGGLGGNKS